MSSDDDWDKVIPPPLLPLAPDPATWYCKIGEVDRSKLPLGADGPLREAIRKAYLELTREEPVFIFSAWDGELSLTEREIVNEDKERKKNA